VATIAIGDIHGNRLALDDLLVRLGTELAPDDAIVFLGDYIDRGPDSKGCIDAILSLRAERAAPVVCLRGNHEDWLLRTMGDHSRHSWLFGMDAFETIRSYSPEAADLMRDAVSSAGESLFIERRELPYDLFLDRMPLAHRTFLEHLAPYYRGRAGMCVHGGLDPLVTHVEDQTLEALLWGVDGFPESYTGAELLVYGHRDNAVLDGSRWPHPRFVGTTIGVDTISHGVLTALRPAVSPVRPFTLNPFAKKPVAEDLIVRVDRARRAGR
jgi:serine/threonine protein phosphatase 1